MKMYRYQIICFFREPITKTWLVCLFFFEIKGHFLVEGDQFWLFHGEPEENSLLEEVFAKRKWAGTMIQFD